MDCWWPTGGKRCIRMLSPKFSHLPQIRFDCLTQQTICYLSSLHHKEAKFCHWQSRLGFKMTHTACTLNINVNHRQRILSTTRGHPAQWNDKALCLFDPFMYSYIQEQCWTQCLWVLCSFTDGEIITESCCACWLLVDNGYQLHPTTIDVIKWTNRMEIQFSIRRLNTHFVFLTVEGRC